MRADTISNFSIVIRPRSVALAAAAFVLCCLYGCSREDQGPERLSVLFGQWFITPTAARTDSLLALKPSADHIHTAAARAIGRERAQPGTAAVVLQDSQDSAWTLGIATPQRFDRDSLYPLVVYLHGGIANAQNDKGRLAWDMLAPLIDSCEAILASPTSTRSSVWWSPTGLERIMQTVRYMSLRYPIDPQRVILAGVSDGAAGCFAAAMIAHSPFAGFIIVSGTPVVLAAAGIPIAAGNMMQRPLYCVNGAKDQLYEIDKVNQALDELTKNGVGILRKVYPEEGHGFDYRHREMATLARLVRLWRKPLGRTGISWRIIPGYLNHADNLIMARVVRKTSGLPALNAHWENGRLVVRSLGVESIVFSSAPLDHPPVVVADGVAREPCRDVTTDIRQVLTAMQQACMPTLGNVRLYEAVF